LGLIQKAKSSLNAAKDLLKGGYSDFSSGRSYYARFYAAQALLLTKNLSFSKHSTVISAFGKEFIKTGILPVSLHKNFSKAFDTRQAGDYGAIGSVSKEIATSLIDQAEEFIEKIENYFEIKNHEL
jgi:uncharacterized protein (UPF0332 family)